MGLGQMRTLVDLIAPITTTDAAGFETTRDEIIATCRADIDTRHATAVWVNRAAYTQATDNFRIRAIPGVTVDASMELSCDRGRFIIDTVENIGGRYLEILAHQCAPEGAS